MNLNDGRVPKTEANSHIKTLVMTGGGTAGHVLPHFALFENPSILCDELNQGTLRVVYVGSETGIERDLVEKNKPDWIYCPIKTGKLRRYFSLANFFDPLKIILGFFQCLLILRKYQVHCVFSKGGFVSVPSVWAAWVLGIPVVIHESDVTLALTTKLTLPMAHKALFAFEESIRFVPRPFRDRSETIGLPLRPSLLSANKEQALQFFNWEKSSRSILLVFGGSLGAEALNQKIADALPDLLQTYRVIHIVGKGKGRPFAHPEYRQYEFLKDEMPYAYACADVAICRAGASSLFELAAAKIPMLLVPLGLNQSRGDQIINAKLFEKNGWAHWVQEQDLTPELLVQKISSMLREHDVLKVRLTSAPQVDKARTYLCSLLLNLMVRKQKSLT